MRFGRRASVVIAIAVGGCVADDAGDGHDETATQPDESGDRGEELVDVVEYLGRTADVLGRIHRLDAVVIEFGEYAKAMAASGDVRSYADRLIKDHERIEVMMNELGDKLGVPPREAQPQHGVEHVDEDSRRALVRAGGLEIDRRFLWIMAGVHSQAIDWLELERSGVHPELGAAIDRILPILRQHEELAHRLLADVPAA